MKENEIKIYHDIENYLYWVDDQGNIWELKEGDYCGKIMNTKLNLKEIGTFKLGD